MLAAGCDRRLSAIAISPADIVDRILDVSSARGAAVLRRPLTGRAINLLGTHGNTVAVAADLANSGVRPRSARALTRYRLVSRGW